MVVNSILQFKMVIILPPKLRKSDFGGKMQLERSEPTLHDLENEPLARTILGLAAILFFMPPQGMLTYRYLNPKVA